MDSSSKLNSSNTSKPMGEIVSSNTSNINNINNNISISIGGSSSNSRMRSKEMENLSFEISKYPRDLLQRFLGGGGNSSQQSRRISSVDDSIIGGNEEEDDEDDEGGLNLGLGLSLGGKFGVDKSNKGLIRSSSIAGTMPLFREQDDGTVVVAPPPLQPPCRGGGVGGGGGLVRTSSLPVETEEEWRKRKDMQTLRRMEAKRRRSEKQRGLKDGGGGGSGGGGGCGEEKGGVEGLKFRGRLEREQQSLGITSKFIGSSMGNLFGSSTPPPPPPSSNVEVKGRRTTFGSLQGFLISQGHSPGSGSGSGLGQSQGQGQGQGQGQQGSSQGSGESQGGTSSGASELESKTHQASSSCGEARSPASTQSLQERPSQDSLGSPGALKGGGDTSQREERGPEMESSSKQPKVSSGIEDMPCVFTIGDGPNGRKVEGILYRYGKGEQVRIMCVCHGTFLSPRDFVKHAGGRDVEHPLRHIVVSPSSSAFQ